MIKLSKREALHEAIYLLQNKQALELIMLKDNLRLTIDSLKPINLFKNALKEVSSSPDIKNNIVDNVIGLTTGYLTKKILLGASRNPIKRVLGVVFQFAISNFVSKHSDNIKLAGKSLVNRLIKNAEKPEQDFNPYEN